MGLPKLIQDLGREAGRQTRERLAQLSERAAGSEQRRSRLPRLPQRLSQVPQRLSRVPQRLSPGMAVRSDYPGDFTDRPRIEYAPHEGHLADPGEIVWAWVPYEEDHRKGKKRPVLVIGRDDPWLLAVPLTSKDHDLDHDQEAAAGRYWMDIGTGAWDRGGRPSEARVNRILRLDPKQLRGTGVRLEEKVFRAVAGEIRQHY